MCDIDVKLADVLMLMQSSCWQLQAISLIILRLRFQKCLSDHVSFTKEASLQQTKGQKRQQAGHRKVSSKRLIKSESKAVDGKSGGRDAPHLSDFLSFCRNGYLRVLIWYTFHTSSLLRQLTVEVTIRPPDLHSI
jgi:hypothetical protein